MLTDQRTGTRSIRAARETLAVVAVVFLLFATLLRCIEGQPGGIAGVVLMLLAVAVVSRYRISWDRQGIVCQTPFWCTRKLWSELSAYNIEPREAATSAARGSIDLRVLLHGFCLHLHGRSGSWTLSLWPYSFDDMRHLRDAVSTELPERESVEVLVS